MIDVKKVKEEATKEYNEEKEREAKSKVKKIMKDLDKAKLVVRNLERELEDCLAEVGQ